MALPGRFRPAVQLEWTFLNAWYFFLNCVLINSRIIGGKSAIAPPFLRELTKTLWR